MEKVYFTRKELIEYCRQKEFFVTQDQIERWHKFDLLPRPKKISLGRGKGTKSVYPEETSIQLIRLLELNKTERLLHNLRFMLWMEGFAIPHQKIIETIKKTVFDPIMKYRVKKKDPFDAAELLSLKLLDKPKGLKMRRNIFRKRLSRGDKESILISFLNLIFGGNPFIEEDTNISIETGEKSLAQIFESFLGLERARSDSAGDAEPWLKGSLVEALSELPRIFNLNTLKKALDNAKSSDLISAREDFLFFTIDLPNAIKVTQLVGENAFGFGLIGRFDQIIEETSIEGKAFMILILLSFRRCGLGNIIDKLRNNITELKETINNVLSNVGLVKDLIKDPEIRSKLRLNLVQCKH